MSTDLHKDYFPEKLFVAYNGHTKLSPQVEDYDRLMDWVNKTFPKLPKPQYMLVYTDKDGDKISITNQNDLQTMYEDTHSSFHRLTIVPNLQICNLEEQTESKEIESYAESQQTSQSVYQTQQDNASESMILEKSIKSSICEQVDQFPNGQSKIISSHDKNQSSMRLSPDSQKKAGNTSEFQTQKTEVSLAANIQKLRQRQIYSKKLDNSIVHSQARSIRVEDKINQLVSLRIKDMMPQIKSDVASSIKKDISFFSVQSSDLNKSQSQGTSKQDFITVQQLNIEIENSQKHSVEPSSFQIKTDKTVHHRIPCSNCNVFPIVGIRYKCTVEADYNLCQKCEDFVEHEHHLVKMRFADPYKQQSYQKRQNQHEQIKKIEKQDLNLKEKKTKQDDGKVTFFKIVEKKQIIKSSLKQNQFITDPKNIEKKVIETFQKSTTKSQQNIQQKQTSKILQRQVPKAPSPYKETEKQYAVNKKENEAKEVGTGPRKSRAQSIAAMCKIPVEKIRDFIQSNEHLKTPQILAELKRTNQQKVQLSITQIKKNGLFEAITLNFS